MRACPVLYYKHSLIWYSGKMTTAASSIDRYNHNIRTHTQIGTRTSTDTNANVIYIARHSLTPSRTLTCLTRDDDLGPNMIIASQTRE